MRGSAWRVLVLVVAGTVLGPRSGNALLVRGVLRDGGSGRLIGQGVRTPERDRDGTCDGRCTFALVGSAQCARCVLGRGGQRCTPAAFEACGTEPVTVPLNAGQIGRRRIVMD